MNTSSFHCTRCGKVTARDDLMVRRVVFQHMGEGISTKRSRVTAWLCESCLKEDLDWNRTPNIKPTYPEKIKTAVITEAEGEQFPW